jgi:hypothetical protein
MGGATPPLHPRLQHLSEAQIDELIARYYARESVRALIDEFEIKGTPSSFVDFLPAAPPHENLTCPYCEGQTLFSSRQSRERTASSIPFCHRCGYQHHARCSCKRCTEFAFEKAKQIAAHKRAVVRAEYVIPARPELDLDNLSFRNAVFLLAAFRHSVSEDFAEIAPYVKGRELLAPTFEFTKSMVANLLHARLVCVSPESCPEALLFTDDLSDCPEYYISKVDWLFLPGVDAYEKKDFLASLEQIARDGQWPDHWRFDAFHLWREIAKAEYFECYAHQLSQRGYEAEFGEKTHAFENLLETTAAVRATNTSTAVTMGMTMVTGWLLACARAKGFWLGFRNGRFTQHRNRFARGRWAD